jgi:cobalt-zinc-cadmium efflux system outer membrane protein
VPRVISYVLLLLSLAVQAEETLAPFEEPQGPLTLGAAIAAALAHSPQLALYPWDLRIADARRVQAGLRPNPEASVEVENIALNSGGSTATTQSIGIGPEGLLGGFDRESESGSSTFGEAEVTLSLAQTFELGGKRAARMAAAEKEREVATWDYEVARAETAAEVVLRFTDVLAAQARLGQQQALVALSEQFEAKVRGLVDAGSVSPLEARRASVEVERARIQQQSLRRELEGARVRLAESWGSSQPQFTEALGDMGATEPVADLQTLREARKAHPMLKRWSAELARRDAMLLLERKQRIPDLTVRLGYRGSSLDAPASRSLSLSSDGIAGSRTRGSGDDWENSLVLEASIPLPIFHRNQGAIEVAELMVGRLSDEQRAWEKSIDNALTVQHGVATAALETIDGLKTRILPELEATLALTREGYERGKFDFLRVLDAQRAVIEVRSELLDAQVEYHLARATMEQLTGAAISAAKATLTGGDLEAQKEDHHE